MTTSRLLKAAWFLVFAGTVAVHASSLDDKVKAFNEAVRDSAPKTALASAYGEGRVYPMLESPASPETESGVEQSVRQIMGALPSKSVQKTGQAVLDEIKAQRKARADAFRANAETVLARVPAIVTKAEKPADLDQILNDIESAQEAQRSFGYSGGEDYQSTVNRLSSTYQFVSLWQDFLSQRANGNLQEALGTLRNLENQRGSGEILIPRSQILDQINALQSKNNAALVSRPARGPDLDPILDGIKTIDDLPAAVRKLGPDNGYPEGHEEAQLKQYAFMYEQARNGLPVTLDSTPQNYGVMPPEPGFARIASMLYAYLLPRFLGSTAPAQNPNEATSDYLDRVIKAAESSQDWTLLQRALTAKIRIAQNRTQPSGVQLFFAGINQEIAGQYSQAVGSYEGALRAPDDYTPAHVIGDRLVAIKKDHPAEYAEAMKRSLTPPVPVLPYNPYAQPGLYPAGIPAPGMYRPSPPATSVPEASPTAAPKTTPATTNSPPAAK